ncbi:MAG TPA: hypothetical protein VM243_05445 [Phycisphaerae bacterium]|nr:hypothetical protein [Phycisphaerae bacterium]
MWLDCEESADQRLFVEGSRSEFVPVVFAENLAEAERYRDLLESVGIPVLVERPGADAHLRLLVSGAVPVRVPEHLHDVASEVVGAAQGDLRGDFDDDFDEDEDEDDDDDLDDDDDFDEDDDDDLDDFD